MEVKKGFKIGPGISGIADIFKYEEYFKNINKTSEFSPEFTSRFINTQLFTQLIEDYYSLETSSTNVSSDGTSNLWFDNRMIYFKKLLREFDKGGLRGLRGMQRAEINVVLDDYLHPHEISIEQAYWHYTDVLSNKLRIHKYESSTSKDYNHISEQVPSAKNIRLLSCIKKSDCIEMNDFYEEILGLSTKEMNMSENVSIPDINKRKLCNVEVLTNKRWQSDIQQFENLSSESPNVPQSEEIIGNFHSCNSKTSGSCKYQRGSKYEFPIFSNRSPSYSSNKYNTPSEVKIVKESHNNYFKNDQPFEIKSRGSYNINKSIELNKNFNPIPCGREYEQMNSKLEYSEPIKTLKTIKSVSNKNSLNSLMKGSKVNAFAFPDRGKYIDKREEEINNFDIESDQNSEDIEVSDSNTKWIDSMCTLKDWRFNDKSVNFPGNYLNSLRFRSISFENRIGISRSTKSIENARQENTVVNDIRKSHNFECSNDKQTRRRIELADDTNPKVNEFEKIYQESIEGVLKTPPIFGIGNKSSLKASNVYGNSRRSLAEQIRINPSNRVNKSNISDEENSKSNTKIDYYNKPTFRVLGEKDIPDEGNARRPDRHRTKINDFNGTGNWLTFYDLAFKLKMNKDRNPRMLSLRNKTNNSCDHVQKYEFKETESISYKQKLIESKENRQVKTKRNLDENIEPDWLDKFSNIKSSENFCPGRTKIEANSEEDSVWNFWNTLKNPLQWFGLNKEVDMQTPEKSHGSEDISDNKSQRNRSISYHAKKPNIESFSNQHEAARLNFKYPKSHEKLKYQNFAKAFRQVHEPTINRD